MPSENTPNDALSAPIDRSTLIRIRDHIKTIQQIDCVYVGLHYGETCLLVEYDLEYYPAEIETVYLNVRWYTNDDFKIHYHETWPDSNWDRRWDRHLNGHNTYDHFHPPPDAKTPGENATYPNNLHEVMCIVEQETNDRIRSLWKDNP
jgi:hypothetical protein